MVQPTGFEDSTHPLSVCKLQKSLYGLRQAPRVCGLLLVLVYVDDILVTGDRPEEVQQIIDLLKKDFKLKHLGLVSYFLGIEVSCIDSDLFLCQKKYLCDLLEKTNMVNCKSFSSPMAAHTQLSKYGEDSFSNPLLYRSTVGALQYLTLTRPDIAYSVNKLSQFLQNPLEEHWRCCKRLLRYLKGTSDLRLQFTSSSSSCLEAFSDADWAGCPNGRRSTGGHCVYFGSNLVVWSSKKQDVVSRSSAEFEYRSLANATCDVIWLHSLCTELDIPISTPHQVWTDNSSVAALASNPSIPRSNETYRS